MVCRRAPGSCPRRADGAALTRFCPSNHRARRPLRAPRDFFNPLAIGAPEPLREIPVKPSRMIHFLDFSNEKMVAKAGDIAKQTDILLGNLEDAIPVDRKEAARAGLIE